MKKLFILIFVIIAIVSCQTNNEDVVKETAIINEEPVTSEVAQECNVQLTENSDEFTCVRYTDSTIYSYQQYSVKTHSHPEYNGDIVTITNLNDGNSFRIGEKESCFFMGIYQHFAIIDEGTGQIRLLRVYDLTVREELFSNSYVEGLSIEDDHLYFHNQATINDEALLPNCPEELQNLDGVGYIEELIYSFKDNELTYTGNFNCYYFE